MINAYVYFDSNRDIKCIANEPDLENSQLYSTAIIPYCDVESFMAGKDNPFNYYVKTRKNSLNQEVYSILKKELSVDFTRSIDNFLSEIVSDIVDEDVLVEHYAADRKLKISINPKLKLFDKMSVEDQDRVDFFSNTTQSVLFFTAKSDPHFLICTVYFSPNEVFNKGSVFVEYNVDVTGASIFTRKLIDNYKYINRDLNDI